MTLDTLSNSVSADLELGLDDDQTAEEPKSQIASKLPRKERRKLKHKRIVKMK